MKNKLPWIVLEKVPFSSYRLRMEHVFLQAGLVYLDEQNRFIVGQRKARFENEYEKGLSSLSGEHEFYDERSAVLDQHKEDHQFETGVLMPSMLGNYYLTLIYAFFEKWAEKIADYIAAREMIDKVKETSGKNKIDQLTSWYKQYVDKDLFSESEVDSLNKLHFLRNVIVHVLNDYDSLEKKYKTKLDEICKTNTHVEILRGYLVIHHEYLTYCVDEITSIFEKLLLYLETKYKGEEDQYRSTQFLE